MSIKKLCRSLMLELDLWDEPRGEKRVFVTLESDSYENQYFADFEDARDVADVCAAEGCGRSADVVEVRVQYARVYRADYASTFADPYVKSLRSELESLKSRNHKEEAAAEERLKAAIAAACAEKPQDGEE